MLLLKRMQEAQSAVIHQFAANRAESAAAYRFFNNDKITMDALESALIDPLRPQVSGKHVLCIQDTTEINYSSHSGRLKASDSHLGPVTRKDEVGFFLHPSLVLEASTGLALGFSDVHIWNRSWEQGDKHERDYASLPLEEKESYRWLKSAQASSEVLSDAKQVTHIADREGDIYQLFSRFRGADLLIRAQTHRRTSQGLLSEYLKELPVSGSVSLKIRGNNGRKKRKASLSIRFSPVRLLRPQNKRKEAAAYVDLHVIEVLEEPGSVPKGEEAIHWCLLTTHSVSTLEEALELIGYYKMRWQIEQLFRLLKTESIDLEAAQLERGEALKKLCVFGLHVALVQLQLVTEREGEAGASASLVWSAEAEAFMRMLQGKLEGKTQKQQCAHKKGTLAWSAWIIARLGGWKGYSSQSPPGPITMRRGIERFMAQFAGWQLAMGNL